MRWSNCLYYLATIAAPKYHIEFEEFPMIEHISAYRLGFFFSISVVLCVHDFGISVRR